MNKDKLQKVLEFLIVSGNPKISPEAFEVIVDYVYDGLTTFTKIKQEISKGDK